jgi:PAS domain S-box-containing protein
MPKKAVANDLRLDQLVNRNPLTAAPDTPLREAIALLHQAGADGCLVVVDGQRFMGLLTERDVVKLVASGQDRTALCLQEVMEPNVPTLTLGENQPVQVIWSLMRRHQLRHLPVVDSQGDWIGLVGQADLINALRPDALTSQDGDYPQPESVVGQLEPALQILAEESPYIIFRLDRQLRHCCISPNVETAWGIPPSAFLGKTYRELGFSVDICDVFEAACQQGFAAGKPVEVEFHLTGRDYSTRLIPELGRSSEIVSLLGISEDITDLKQAELSLQQQIRQEHLLADIAQDIRNSLHLDKVLFRTVQRVREWLHTDRVIIFRFRPDWQGDVITESVGADWPSILSTTIYDPCFNERCIEPYRQGRIATMTDIDTEDLEPCYVELLKPLQVKANLVVPILQGDNLWGLLIAHECSAPRQWQPEEVALVRRLATQVGIAIQQSELYEQTRLELQERERIQRVLEESEQRLQAILDHSPAVIYLLDQQNRHLLVNRSYADLLSTTPDTLVGKPIHEVWPTEIADTFAAHNRTVLETGQRLQIEEIAPHPDGQPHTYITVKFPLIDTTGHPYAICGISTDITEKKQMEAQFYRAQRLESLGTLASGISHDLNNILTPILAIAQLLPLKFSDADERTRELFSTLETSARRGTEVVKQILSFTRGTGDNHIPLQAAHLLNEVFRMARRTFPANLEILLSLPRETLWLVSADATQLHQVFMNLAINARDAMPDGGQLTFAAENVVLDEQAAQRYFGAQVGPYVCVTISDTGCGIDPNLREQIFDPFFTTKAADQGTGLGLATVQGIVTSHAGFVQVDSEPGQGSTFSIYLPASPDPLAANHHP